MTFARPHAVLSKAACGCTAADCGPLKQTNSRTIDVEICLRFTIEMKPWTLFFWFCFCCIILTRFFTFEIWRFYSQYNVEISVKVTFCNWNSYLPEWHESSRVYEILWIVNKYYVTTTSYGCVIFYLGNLNKTVAFDCSTLISRVGTRVW